MDSPRPSKRRRVSGSKGTSGSASGLVTPISPSNEKSKTNTSSHSSSKNILTKALDVLRVEAEALSNIHKIYTTDSTARQGLSSAVSAILNAQKSFGKLVVCGVGKSAYIAQKLVATAKSLGIPASFMHACEAAHGDLGDLRASDVLLFVSFSGKTPELLNLLPHISPKIRLMAMSSQRRKEDCLLLQGADDGVLLPAPIHESEESTFGVKAPTTSTTVALAVADMLILTVADEMHRDKTHEVFTKNHPGGAIGLDHREVEKLREAEVDVSVLELPPSPEASGGDEY